MLAFWLSLAFLLIALAAGLAYAVVRALQLWRLIKRTSSTFSDEASHISDSAAQIERRLAEVSAATGRLTAATARLAEARARLEVQRAAINEARTDVKRMLWFVPGL